MKQATYLSVGKPEMDGLTTDDQMEITESIRVAIVSFIQVFLGRRKLVWCGHPEIDSQIRFMANEFNIDYDSWIKTYPDSETVTVKNQKTIMNNKDKSLDSKPDSDFNTRETMFKMHKFSHAVFIGGNQSSIEEYNQFKFYNPNAQIIPVVPSGGAAIEISRMENSTFDADTRKRKYISKFYELLGIGFQEKRYLNPEQKERFEEFNKLSLMSFVAPLELPDEQTRRDSIDGNTSLIILANENYVNSLKKTKYTQFEDDQIGGRDYISDIIFSVSPTFLFQPNLDININSLLQNLNKFNVNKQNDGKNKSRNSDVCELPIKIMVETKSAKHFSFGN